MKTNTTLLVATLAALLALPATALAEDRTNQDGDKVPCWGVNRCKGVGACSAEGCRQYGGCHGSNACRRQGFLRLDKETCLSIEGGRVTKAKPAAKKVAAKKAEVQG